MDEAQKFLEILIRCLPLALAVVIGWITQAVKVFIALRWPGTWQKSAWAGFTLRFLPIALGAAGGMLPGVLPETVPFWGCMIVGGAIGGGVAFLWAKIRGSADDAGMKPPDPTGTAPVTP